MYWFVIVKQVGNLSNFNEVKEVFEAENRETAKQYCINKYGDLPFRKTKNLNEGDKYFYLTESSEYWWNYHNEPVTFDCVYCNKSVEVIGQKNNRGFCSDECKESHYKKLEELKYGEGGWINKSDHIEEKDGMPYGYIYKITNKKTMKCYIGQTVNVPVFRWWQHLKENSNKFEQETICDLVFEVIDIVYYPKDLPNTYHLKNKLQDELNFLEAKYIKIFNSANEGYNTIQPHVEKQISLFD